MTNIWPQLQNFKRRKKEDQIRSVLQVLTDRGMTNYSRLLLLSEMNSSQINSVLVFLLSEGLIVKVQITKRLLTKQNRPMNTKSLYAITEEGLDYLQLVQKRDSMIDYKVKLNTKRAGFKK